ncbi:hypothetical protein GUJ93_ZPchr0009g2047 [Zizania palustris]|uniref:Pectinesterase inhibitor domain-containing protein n=1 Tax=Zizania palustris TaxID=103762 RepID=A0A8J5V2P8_ZIZPA|nr:hypothetical protein GUJ93_ZPchr0009g2047 [Zizania palustris]
MRPPLAAGVVLVLVVAAAVATSAAAVVVLRHPKASGKPGRPTVPAVPVRPKPAPAPIAPGGDIVDTLCAKTAYPVLCHMSVVPKPGRKLDAAGVLRLAMDVVRAKAADAKKAADALIADPKTVRLALGPLRDCVETYDDISYNLDQADKAIAAGDKDTTGTVLDSVCTDVDTCDQGFEDLEELTPLLSKQDDELAKLASMCIAIAAAAGLR